MFGFHIPPPWSVGQSIWNKVDGSEWTIIKHEDEDFLIQTIDKVHSLWTSAKGLEDRFLKEDPSEYANVKKIAKQDGWVWRDKFDDDD